MRTWMPLTLALALMACGQQEPFRETGDTDVEPPPPVDADGDGFDVDSDCDDTDGDINPDAVELCDQVDNNCDTNIDEGYDDDGDGYYSQAKCDFGDDCNDRNGKINPGADDIPYNGEDEDCSGADLTDVDGDGYDGEPAGGDDCLDEDASVNPGVAEIPYDGIDQDCSGADLLDVDGDGHDSIDYGGDDCDDNDARFNPSRFDWANDGVDSDCSGADATEQKQRLSRALVTIDGTTGFQEWMGHRTFTCDFDGDGFQDLVVSAPLANSYAGRVGIWLSDYADAWLEEMTMDDRDVEIAGSASNAFLGSMAACGDINGDGRDDLVLGRAEIRNGSFNTDLTLNVFFGDDSWAYAMTESRADIVLTSDIISSPTSGATLHIPEMSLGDLNGDGKDEIVLGVPKWWPTQDQDEVWVFDGAGLPTGRSDLLESRSAVLHLASPQDIDGAGRASRGTGFTTRVGPDIDGDGNQDLVVGLPDYQVDPEAGGGDPVYNGVLFMISGLEGDASLEDAAYARYVGAPNQYLGNDLDFADVDGSGALDLIVGSGDDSTVTRRGGSVHVLVDPTGLTGDALVIEDDATYSLRGTSEDEQLGVSLDALYADVDQDGLADFVVRQGNYDSGFLTYDEDLYVVSGDLLGADVAVTAATLIQFERQFESAETGDPSVAADVDRDGAVDFFFAAPRMVTYQGSTGRASGRVYAYRSTEWGWGYRMGL